MEGYGATLGLAKEVPLDDFYQGLKMKDLQEQRKIAEEEKKKKYQEELFKMVDRSKVKILPVFQKEYYGKLDPLLADVLYKQNQGTITPQDIQNYNMESKRLGETYEGLTNAAEDFRKRSAKELTPEGIELQNAFLGNESWSELKPKLVEKFKNHPAGYVTPDGDLNLGAFVVTSQDPIGELGKLNTSSYKLWSQQNNSVFGGKELVSGHGALKSNADRGKLTYLPPEQRAVAPTFESMLDTNLNNAEFIRNVRANHPKEFTQAVDDELMRIASKAATNSGLKIGSPEYDKKVAELFPKIRQDYNNNPDNEIGIQQRAVKKVAMDKYQPEQTIETKYISQPKVGKSGSGSGATKQKGVDLHASIQDKITKKSSVINKIIDESSNPAVSLGKALGLPTQDFADNKPIFYNIPLDNYTKKAYKDYVAPITPELKLVGANNETVKLTDVLNDGQYKVLLNSLGGELDANINSEYVVPMTSSGERIYGKDVKKGKAILKNADLKNQRMFVIDTNRIGKRFPKDKNDKPIIPADLQAVLTLLKNYKVIESKNYKTDDVSGLDFKDQTKEYGLEAGDEIPSGEDNGYVEVPKRPKR